MEDWFIKQARAVGRSENPREPEPELYAPALVEIGLTDLPKSGGEAAQIHKLFL